MSEIKLITGVLIHEGSMMTAQIKMLKIFLYTGFGMLTKEEVVQAFYLNLQGKFGETYRHFQKELNCEFLGDVLKAFLKYKLYIRENRGPELTKIMAPPTVAVNTIDYDFFKELIQKEYEHFRVGRNDTQMWHVRKYYTLRKFGLLPFKGLHTWIYFIKQVLPLSAGHLLLPANVDLKRYKFSTVGQVRAIFSTSEGYQRCIDRARMFGYWYILQACMDCGINNLWGDIRPAG